MPTVQTYRRQQQTQAAPNVQRPLYPNPPQLQTPLVTQPKTQGAYGQLGRTLAGLGQQLYANELQKQDDIRLTQAERKLSDWELSTIYDPQNGALMTEGEAVYGLHDKVSESFDKTAGDIRTGLSNDRQRLRFDQIANGRRASVLQRVQTHVAGESSKIDDQETQAYIKNEQSIGAHNASDPDQVALHRDNIQRTTAQYAQRRHYAPEQTKLLVDSNVSDYHLGIISQMLATGDDIRAKTYFETVKPEIDGTKLGQVEEALHTGSIRGESQRQADRIWNLNKDANLEELQAEAEKISDPEVQDQTAQRLENFYRMRKTDQAETAQRQAQASKALIDQTMKQMENLIDVKKPMFARDIVPPDIWDNLPGETRNALETYTRQYHKPEGAAARKTDQSVWHALYQEASIDPAKFAKENIYKYLGKLSDSDFQELEKLQYSIRTGKKDGETEKQLKRFSTTEQIIANAFGELKIVKPKEGTPEYAAWAKLHQDISDKEADYAREHNNATPDDEQVKKWVAERLTDVPAFKKGYFWNFYTDKKLQKRAMDITTADIPEAVRNEIADRLRAAGLAVSEENIVEMYLDAVQKTRR